MTSIVLTRGSRSPAGSTFGSLPRVSVRRAQHRRRTEGKLSLVVSGLVVLAVVAVLGWDLFGGRLFVMETPSMCPAVCVGSLVADGPVRGPLHVGELITFHPPGTKTETYTHEISHIFPNGMIQTRGVANPDHDPWLITRSDIVGIVDLNVWGLGWLLRVLPFLAVGVLAWVLARPRLALTHAVSLGHGMGDSLGRATAVGVAPTGERRGPLHRVGPEAAIVRERHKYRDTSGLLQRRGLPSCFPCDAEPSGAPGGRGPQGRLRDTARSGVPLLVGMGDRRAESCSRRSLVICGTSAATKRC